MLFFNNFFTRVTGDFVFSVSTDDKITPYSNGSHDTRGSEKNTRQFRSVAKYFAKNSSSFLCYYLIISSGSIFSLSYTETTYPGDEIKFLLYRDTVREIGKDSSTVPRWIT